MMSTRFLLSALAVCTAFPAFAAVNTTYNFGSAGMSATNPSLNAANATTATATTSTTKIGDTRFLTGNGQYTDGGTNYGNTITWAGSTSGSSVTVSAWSTTNVVGGVAKFESAYIGNYGGDLGVTGQPNAALTGNGEIDPTTHQTSPPEHAIDNIGAYDALLFSFASSVNLADVSIGYPTDSKMDSDATILYWAGTGDPTKSTSTGGGLSMRTIGDLTSNGWRVATNEQLSLGNNATNISPSIASSYWLVGAYMPISGTVPTNVNGGNDYFKVNGITTAPRLVPEPGTLALFGIAGIALFARRRRTIRQD